MTKFPTYEQMAKDVAEKALDEFLYDGKSIREWMQIIASEDCISRQAVLDLIEHYNSDGLGSVFYGYEEGVKFADAIKKLPPVNPQENERNCVTCEWSKDSHCAGTEECHLCMWESQYKPKTDGMTNGEVLKALFPDVGEKFSKVVDWDVWWNAPYKAESEVKK